MSGRKGGRKRAASPGAAILSPCRRHSGASSSRCALPSGTGGPPAASPAVSAVPSSVPVPLSVPIPGPVRPAAGGATYVVSPELMAAMAREPLRVPELSSPGDVVGAYRVHLAVDGEEGHFRVAEVVMRILLLREHLPLSAVEYQEFRLCMGRYCCPAYLFVYTNKSV